MSVASAVGKRKRSDARDSGQDASAAGRQGDDGVTWDVAALVVARRRLARLEGQEVPTDPPRLIGGSSQVPGEALSRAVDWLSATIPQDMALWLVDHTYGIEEGGSKAGFAESDIRATPSGGGSKVLRKSKPMQASRAYGLAYEGWEFMGRSATWGAEVLRGRECRARRVDIAWDFTVADAVTPETFLRGIGWDGVSREYLGLSVSRKGDVGRETYYVGSYSSSRQLRIYRKDWEEPCWFFGPTLRVELIMRDDRAEAWWHVWDGDQAEGYAAGAAHVFEMLAVVIQEVGEVPQVVEPESKSEAQAAAQFVFQYGQYVETLRQAGELDGVLRLCRRRAETVSRENRSRMVDRARRIRGYPVGEMARVAARLLEMRKGGE